MITLLIIYINASSPNSKHWICHDKSLHFPLVFPNPGKSALIQTIFLLDSEEKVTPFLYSCSFPVYWTWLLHWIHHYLIFSVFPLRCLPHTGRKTYAQVFLHSWKSLSLLLSSPLYLLLYPTPTPQSSCLYIIVSNSHFNPLPSVPALTCLLAKVMNDMPVDKYNDLYGSYNLKIPVIKMSLPLILKMPTAAVFSFQLFTSSLSVYSLDTDILLVSFLGHDSPHCSLASLLMPYVLFYCYLPWFL